MHTQTNVVTDTQITINKLMSRLQISNTQDIKSSHEWINKANDILANPIPLFARDWTYKFELLSTIKQFTKQSTFVTFYSVPDGVNAYLYFYEKLIKLQLTSMEKEQEYTIIAILTTEIQKLLTANKHTSQTMMFHWNLSNQREIIQSTSLNQMAKDYLSEQIKILILYLFHIVNPKKHNLCDIGNVSETSMNYLILNFIESVNQWLSLKDHYYIQWTVEHIMNLLIGAGLFKWIQYETRIKYLHCKVVELLSGNPLAESVFKNVMLYTRHSYLNITLINKMFNDNTKLMKHFHSKYCKTSNEIFMNLINQLPKDRLILVDFLITNPTNNNNNTNVNNINESNNYTLQKNRNFINRTIWIDICSGNTTHMVYGIYNMLKVTSGDNIQSNNFLNWTVMNLVTDYYIEYKNPINKTFRQLDEEDRKANSSKSKSNFVTNKEKMDSNAGEMKSVENAAYRYWEMNSLSLFKRYLIEDRVRTITAKEVLEEIVLTYGERDINYIFSIMLIIKKIFWRNRDTVEREELRDIAAELTKTAIIKMYKNKTYDTFLLIFILESSGDWMLEYNIINESDSFLSQSTSSPWEFVKTFFKFLPFFIDYSIQRNVNFVDFECDFYKIVNGYTNSAFDFINITLINLKDYTEAIQLHKTVLMSIYIWIEIWKVFLYVNHLEQQPLNFMTNLNIMLPYCVHCYTHWNEGVIKCTTYSVLCPACKGLNIVINSNSVDYFIRNKEIIKASMSKYYAMMNDFFRKLLDKVNNNAMNVYFHKLIYSLIWFEKYVWKRKYEFDFVGDAYEKYQNYIKTELNSEEIVDVFNYKMLRQVWKVKESWEYIDWL